jgi:hypothetical protein
VVAVAQGLQLGVEGVEASGPGCAFGRRDAQPLGLAGAAGERRQQRVGLPRRVQAGPHGLGREEHHPGVGDRLVLVAEQRHHLAGGDDEQVTVTDRPGPAVDVDDPVGAVSEQQHQEVVGVGVRRRIAGHRAGQPGDHDRRCARGVPETDQGLSHQARGSSVVGAL